MKLPSNTLSDSDWRKHLEGTIYQSNIRSYQTDEGDYGPYVLFNLDGGVEDNTAVFTSTKCNPKSNLGKLVKAIYPTFEFGDEVDLDTLIGMPVAVMFTHKQRDDGTWTETAKVVAKGENDTKDYDDEAPF